MVQMCGIFGYASDQERNAFGIIHNGLLRLQYRGYDSWGISLLKNHKIKTYKTTQKLGLAPTGAISEAKMGIGHTRWATHGGVTQNNAHPHKGGQGSFVLAQNGIVENFGQLKDFLIKKGYKFQTQTDTEVIVKLIEYFGKATKNTETSVIKAFGKLKGRNTIIVLTNDGRIIAIKNGSPLVIGVGENELFFSSDTLSFADHTREAIVLEDMEMATLDGMRLKIRNLATGQAVDRKPVKLEYGQNKIDKEGFDHFMLKEIVEQKDAILAATSYTMAELTPLIELIQKSRQVFTIGAGTASYAAGQTAYFLRKHASVKAIELKAYETDSHTGMYDKNSVMIGFSQSGETADTLEALATARKGGVKIVSLVNMQGSTMSRESQLAYYLRVGPEISVVSTKAFAGQVAWGYLLAQSLAGNYHKVKTELEESAKKLTAYLKPDNFLKIEQLAKELLRAEHIFVLGRGQNYYPALEGALKIKETSYRHAEAFSAGELKHGIIALIDQGVPVIGIISEDAERSNMLSAILEIKARRGTVIGVGKKEYKECNMFLKTPDLGGLDGLSNVIPFQLLGYYLGKLQGFDPDKPRNLAKSVTVR